MRKPKTNKPADVVDLRPYKHLSLPELYDELKKTLGPGIDLENVADRLAALDKAEKAGTLPGKNKKS